MTHSTGHASALGRNLDTNFGSPAYAEEEASLAGESHDMTSASEHQPEIEIPENVLSAAL